MFYLCLCVGEILFEILFEIRFDTFYLCLCGGRGTRGDTKITFFSRLLQAAQKNSHLFYIRIFHLQNINIFEFLSNGHCIDYCCVLLRVGVFSDCDIRILTQIVTFVFKQIKDDLIWVRHALGKTQISQFHRKMMYFQMCFSISCCRQSQQWSQTTDTQLLPSRETTAYFRTKIPCFHTHMGTILPFNKYKFSKCRILRCTNINFYFYVQKLISKVKDTSVQKFEFPKYRILQFIRKSCFN